jgi:hypothetical protein
MARAGEAVVEEVEMSITKGTEVIELREVKKEIEVIEGIEVIEATEVIVEIEETGKLVARIAKREDFKVVLELSHQPRLNYQLMQEAQQHRPARLPLSLRKLLVMPTVLMSLQIGERPTFSDQIYHTYLERSIYKHTVIILIKYIKYKLQFFLQNPH